MINTTFVSTYDTYKKYDNFVTQPGKWILKNFVSTVPFTNGIFKMSQLTTFLFPSMVGRDALLLVIIKKGKI